MKRTEILAWFLVGLLVGIVIGLWLAARTAPPPQRDCAMQPQPAANIEPLYQDIAS